MPAADPIAVIEAGYRLGGDRRAWLHSVGTALRPLLDGGFGVTAYAYDLAVPPDRWFDEAVLVDAAPETLDFARELVRAHQSIARKHHVDPSVLGSSMEAQVRDGVGVPGRGPEHWERWCARLGIGDVLALRTVEPGGRGLVVAGGQRTFSPAPAGAKRLWARVAAHLAAARRLRESLASPVEHASEPESIFTPSGKLEHAAGDACMRTARESLRTAVLRRERARARAGREDAVRAVEAWRALVAGRWSLVDRFESDGRRYVVALENRHGLADPRALTPRERAVAHLAAMGKANKLIAYELGLAESTVATHLATSMKKLGARHRVDLVDTLFRSAEEIRKS